MNAILRLLLLRDLVEIPSRFGAGRIGATDSGKLHTAAVIQGPIKNSRPEGGRLQGVGAVDGHICDSCWHSRILHRDACRDLPWRPGCAEINRTTQLGGRFQTKGQLAKTIRVRMPGSARGGPLGGPSAASCLVQCVSTVGLELKATVIRGLQRDGVDYCIGVERPVDVRQRGVEARDGVVADLGADLRLVDDEHQ